MAYFNKDNTWQDVASKITSHSGEPYESLKRWINEYNDLVVTVYLTNAAGGKMRLKHPVLTQRDIEILHRIIYGKSNGTVPRMVHMLKHYFW